MIKTTTFCHSADDVCFSFDASGAAAAAEGILYWTLSSAADVSSVLELFAGDKVYDSLMELRSTRLKFLKFKLQKSYKKDNSDMTVPVSL